MAGKIQIFKFLVDSGVLFQWYQCQKEKCDVIVWYYKFIPFKKIPRCSKQLFPEIEKKIHLAAWFILWFCLFAG